MTGRELVALSLIEIKDYVEGINKIEDRFYLGLEQISSVKPFGTPRVIKFPIYDYMVIPFSDSTYLATLETVDTYLTIRYTSKIVDGGVEMKVERIQRVINGEIEDYGG